jgi:hypothetical protein
MIIKVYNPILDKTFTVTEIQTDGLAGDICFRNENENAIETIYFERKTTIGLSDIIDLIADWEGEY